jgi:hypothetical protein
MATAEVARVTRYAVNYVREIARRHREEGPAAIGDCRHGIPGGAPLTPAVRQGPTRGHDPHRAAPRPW